MNDRENRGMPALVGPVAAESKLIILWGEEQAEEDEDLTRAIRKEKAQQAPEDPNRTRDIEREKQKQKENVPPAKEPVPPKPKR